MPSKNPKELIRSKLTAYANLLDDPVFVALLPDLMAAAQASATGKPAPNRQQKLALKHAKNRVGRKPGPLSRQAKKVVINAMREVSAKDVVAQLEDDGTLVKGAPRNAVKVSKLLRKLAKDGEIASRRSGPGKKSAILYQSNALAQSFPVQEKTVTQ